MKQNKSRWFSGHCKPNFQNILVICRTIAVELKKNLPLPNRRTKRFVMENLNSFRKVSEEPEELTRKSNKVRYQLLSSTCITDN